MSGAARVAAQAKINLRLRILAREASGYHTLETIFCRLDLADDVHVRAGSGVRGRTLDVTGAAPNEIGDAARNLAMRAAVAYAEVTGWPEGFAIELTKRIPIGGGLGGGSADAGAVLRALDALSPRPLRRRLLALAASLGSDVPFLAAEHPLALAWGRGERMLALAPLPARNVVLACPPFGVATVDAYSWMAALRPPAYTAGSEMIAPAMLSTWTAVAALTENDFEAVVAARHPEIEACARALRGAGASIAMMSGSGSTVFGVYDDAAAARAGADAAAACAAGVRVVTTRTAAGVAPVERSAAG